MGFFQHFKSPIAEIGILGSEDTSSSSPKSLQTGFVSYFIGKYGLYRHPSSPKPGAGQQRITTIVAGAHKQGHTLPTDTSRTFLQDPSTDHRQPCCGFSHQRSLRHFRQDRRFRVTDILSGVSKHALGPHHSYHSLW